MSPIQEIIQKVSASHGTERESLLPILQAIYAKNHILTEEDMIEVARELDISAAHVYGTATFYSFLETQQSGKYIIRLCRTITCMMHGKNIILQELERLLKIKPGQTTPDGIFTLTETNCLGQCHKGPAMLVNDTPHTDLTPESIREIIDKYRREALQ
ncbi:NADH-quinone oxidoreductase subunit NuoE family protein [Alkalitalea saponilacus]|uniref:NADH:ubiquinone oxidoreductase subunit (Chain E) n=1 Tax=Alkalitalea saponilacus TaxID=889453 RepID=A0A1T5BC00_9BACT|nr:NAD(P)H-dependent oxidoreductase subunit E [Alkalitalea saponilacus]ASB49720.1 peroxiredoxin family protein [Alkalitalea saponilacus]SKB44831.1 NADH:ubiquinone oxidoreductase subunit (chain E) [Alkalitalea saponilacus]